MPRGLGYRKHVAPKRSAWAEWLDERIMELGLSQPEAAALFSKALGRIIHQSTVSRWCSGECEPVAETREKIREALGGKRGQRRRAQCAGGL